MDFPICPPLSFEYLPFPCLEFPVKWRPWLGGCSSCDALVLAYKAVTGSPFEYMR